MRIIDFTSLGKNLIDTWNKKSSDESSLIFDENVELICSMAQRMITETSGHIKGKNTIFSFWDFLKSKYPDSKVEYLYAEPYQSGIIVYYSFLPLCKKALGIISVNDYAQITKLKLCHI